MGLDLLSPHDPMLRPFVEMVFLRITGCYAECGNIQDWTGIMELTDQTTTEPRRKRGAKPGHPGWGGRPSGPLLAACLTCKVELRASDLRKHFPCKETKGDEYNA